MRWARWVASATVMGVVLLGSAGKSSAELESDNGCQGSGTFRQAGLKVDAAGVGADVVEIPRSDTVDWEGSVDAPPGVYSGSISIDLPPPFGEAQIDSWDGDSQNTANSGAREYDLPSFVPAGVQFQVDGSHTDENGFCTGFVNFEINGGPFDSPLAPASLVGTLATGVGLVFVVRPLFKGGTA